MAGETGGRLRCRSHPTAVVRHGVGNGRGRRS